jgi:hypothetical protein
MHIASRFGGHARCPVGQFGRFKHGGFHFRHFRVLYRRGMRRLCVAVIMVMLVIVLVTVTAMQRATLVAMFMDLGWRIKGWLKHRFYLKFWRSLSFSGCGGCCTAYGLDGRGLVRSECGGLIRHGRVLLVAVARN